MLFVRCMLAWRASLGPAPIPISRSMAALSTAPKSAAGGKSTTRKTEPRGGGATPISRAALSALPDSPAGDSSVTHRSVETRPVAFLSLTFGAAPSIRTTALPFASWPVTTRLVGCLMPSVEKARQAASGLKRNFRSAREIASAFRAETPQWSLRLGGHFQSSDFPVLYELPTRWTSEVYSTAAPKGATKYAKTLLPGP